METAQDILNKEFLEDDEKKSNETLDLFEFMRRNSTHLSNRQIKGMNLLAEYGLEELAILPFQYKDLTVHSDIYFKTLDKLTLADRIKGNAKLSHLVKSDGLANPANALKAQDMQAQAMRRNEIDRY